MLLDISPWIAGAAFGYLLGLKTEKKYGIGPMLSMGLYSYLALFLCTAVLWLGYVLQFNALHSGHYLFWTALAALLSTLCIYKFTLRLKSRTKQEGAFSKLILGSAFLLPTASFTSLALTSFQVPVFSWDVLQGGEWGVPSFADRAILFIRQSLGEIVISTPYDYRHPMTNFLLLAWGAQAPTPALGEGSHAIWLCLLLSTALVCGGYSCSITNKRMLSYLICWMVISLPLLANHGMVPGYNGIFLTLSTVCTCATFSLAIRYKNTYYFALSLTFLASIMFTKSFGVAYFIAITASAVLFFAIQANRQLTTALLLGGVFFLGWQIWHGFDITLGSHTIAWSPDTLEVSFAGRTQYLSGTETSTVLNNFYTSIIKMQSFSILALIIPWSALFVISVTRRRDDTRNMIYLAMTYICCISILSAIQLTSYGSQTAQPGADTLFSRISLPAHCLLYLFIPHLVNACAASLPPPRQISQNKPRKHSDHAVQHDMTGQYRVSDKQ